MNTTQNTAHFSPISLIIAIILAVLASASYAHEPSEYRMHSGRYDMGQMGMGQMGMMHGMGMMGSMPMRDLGLSQEQRQNIRAIQKKLRQQHWGLKDKIMDYSDQLEELYAPDKPDAKKIGAIYKEIFEIKRQMIESNINAQNQQYEIFNKEQQEKIKNWRSGMLWHHDDDHMERGMGYGRRHMMR